MAQPDPSHSVPQELMSHVHLISSFRYPTMPRLDLNDVAKWLMSAPQVARDRAPFFWTYLDKPADGTIFLTWQPLQRLGTNFATDGFIWAPPEHVFKQDLVNGLMLEIYYLKAGYVPGEQFTMHTRRRFRFVPVAGHPNPPQPDMSLFIVHYGSSEPGDRLPAQVVPYDERVNAIMQQRHYLLRAGQIRRKEFMLSDRVNWPSLPELTRQQMGPQMLPRGIPQQMAYPTQPPPGPLSKRARHAPSNGGQQGGMPGMSVGEQSVEEEEDITHGDMLDQMTQREISLNRYRQNHEWMEEILSSAYRMNQITPVDLNLGLKGELASLTEGIFTAQGAEVFGPPAEKPYIGRLDPGLADEFRKRIKEHVESTQEEIKKMEAAHTEAMTELKKSSLYAVKEAELRAVAKRAPLEAPQPEGQADPGSEEGWIQSAWARNEEEVTQEIEAGVGRKVEVKPRIKRIQHGGFEAPVPEQTPAPTSAAAAQMSHQMSRAGSQNGGLILGESDIDMGGTAAGLLDQMHTGFSSMTTPVNNFSTPQAQLSAAHSNVATPSNAPKEPLPATVPSAAAPAAPALFQPTGDVTMGGTEAPLKKAELKSAMPDSDWVVVPKCGETSEARAGQGQATAAATVIGDMPKPVAAVAAMATTTTAGGKPSPAAATPAVTDGGGTANYDQNDFSSLGDLDTPGGALVGLDAPELDGAAGELGDGLDLQMDMEDSAFGEAFHGVDGGSGTPGEGPGQDV